MVAFPSQFTTTSTQYVIEIPTYLHYEVESVSPPESSYTNLYVYTYVEHTILSSYAFCNTCRVYDRGGVTTELNGVVDIPRPTYTLHP